MAKKITPQHVFDQLKKTHPEKYPDLTLDDIEIYESGAVRVNGKFAPGFTGNAKGRAVAKKAEKSKSFNTADKKELAELIVKKDIGAIMQWFTERADNLKDAFRMVKELAPYYAPKLANVESHTREDKTIQINWVDSGKDLIDITPQEYKEQTKAALKILDKEPQPTKK